MATGQVAGVARAICAKEDCFVLDANIDSVKKALKDLGAIVP
jgi:DNA-binding FrmR family transcriptional regulator